MHWIYYARFLALNAKCDLLQIVLVAWRGDSRVCVGHCVSGQPLR